LTETTAGQSQPELYFNQDAYEPLYKIGPNEPEFTGDKREEIKERKNTHANTREGRKGGHSKKILGDSCRT
jgi:hypothetical protein